MDTMNGEGVNTSQLPNGPSRSGEAFSATSSDALNESRALARDQSLASRSPGDRIKTATVSGLQKMASSLHHQVPTAPRPLDALAGGTAKTLNQAAAYIQGSSMESVKDDVSDTVRRHPLKSLAVGLGIGLVFGRIVRR